MKYSDKQVRGGMAVERQWRGVGGEHSLMATHTHTRVIHSIWQVVSHSLN